MAAWRAFTRPNVKDLAYALACPSALARFPDELSPLAARKSIILPQDDFWQSVFKKYAPRLKQLDKNPKPLNRFLAENLVSHRLGFRFEALILFWLQDAKFHDFELIGHNIQVFKNGATTGELDFIVRNTRTGKIEHWELALKHYLAHPPFAADKFVGLNEKDTLAHKLNHMLTKQFRFEHVNVDGIDYKIDTRRAIIKGRFFLPKTDSPSHTKLPSWLNLAFPLGLWQAGFNGLENSEQWRRAHRVEWLTKRDFLDEVELGKHKKQLECDVARFSGRRVPLKLSKGLYFHLAHEKPNLKTTKNQSQLRRDWLVIKG